MNNNETNKVQLSLSDYTELYEFRKNLDEKGLVMVKTDGGYNRSLVTFATIENAWENIGEINKKLNEELERFQDYSKSLEMKNKDLVYQMKQQSNESGNILERIKNYSIWEFIKWRRKK